MTQHVLQGRTEQEVLWFQRRGFRRQPPAGAINHTDEELEFLARLVGQHTAWQIAGRKGEKAGDGYSSQPSTRTR